VWCDIEKWKARARPRDGAGRHAGRARLRRLRHRRLDGFRAETEDGYQFTPTYGPAGMATPTIWNPADWGGQVPRLEVADAVEELMRRFTVVRLYADPPYWTTEVDGWAAKYGEKVVIRWYTQRPVQMQAAADRLQDRRLQVGLDVHPRRLPEHPGACRGDAQGAAAGRDEGQPAVRADQAGRRPEDRRLRDSILCHEAAGDVTAAKLWPVKARRKVIVMR
jgi:hypothetical protein